MNNSTLYESSIAALVRPNILKLKGYQSASAELNELFTPEIKLDANEFPYGEYRSYPVHHYASLRKGISKWKQIPSSHIFTSNGSDEIIDLLIRIFCQPTDKILVFNPSYDMYKVQAQINGISVLESELDADGQPNIEALSFAFQDPKLKLIFLCSPNNPTGISIKQPCFLEILQKFQGIVVVDEAYIDFSNQASLIYQLPEFPKLMVIQTFSKSKGMAGLRLGMGFAHPYLIMLLDKVRYPYHISSFTEKYALELLNHVDQEKKWIQEIIQERNKLQAALIKLSFVVKIYPSDANFLLVEFLQYEEIFQWLLKNGIAVRNRNKAIPGTLRITIGSPKENAQLIQMLNSYEKNTLYR